METRRIPVVLGVICALALGPVAGGASATVEGRWVLVEQHYGKGRSGLAPQENPVHLEFVREGGRIAGRIWAGDSRSAAVSWPAFALEDGEGRHVRLQVDEYEASPGGKRVLAAYTVDPSVDSKLVLKIVEDYRLADGGRVLKGTVTVKLTELDAGTVRVEFVKTLQPVSHIQAGHLP